ncbi:MAG: nuclear transport factor 2 family protein [Sphingomonadaceae bacterium]|nr:nuclear transport factor 2 family protein [Sphingomonadaceae bacterium]
MSDAVEERLMRLEAESEIRSLKARYLNACDAKEPDRIRACFTADARLDYGPMGKFGVDGLIAIFTQIAVDSPIIDTHHGHNGEVELVNATQARGKWSLAFNTYDPRNGEFRSLTGFYDDEYLLTGDGWRVAASTFAPRVTFSGVLKDVVVDTAP